MKKISVFALLPLWAWAQPIPPPIQFWTPVGAGALANAPATCTANRDVYICTGAGCTSGNNILYCTATNTFTSQGGGGGAATGNATFCADTSGSGTAYVCATPSPNVTTLTGLYVALVPQITSTGAATLNVASLGAKALKLADGVTNVPAGALVGGQQYIFTYNGTNLVQDTLNTSTQLTDTANLLYTNLPRTLAALLTAPGGDLFNGGSNHQVGTSYTIASTDDNKLVDFNNAAAVAVTLPQAGTAGFGSGFFMLAFNRGAGTVTITPTTSTFNGNANIALATNEGVFIESDGSNYTGPPFRAAGTGAAAATVSTTFSATPTFTCPDNAKGTDVYFTLSTTISASITGAFSNCTVGSILIIKFVQNATGGFTASITNADSFFINPAANAQTVCVFDVESATALKTAGCVSNTGYSAGLCVAAPGTPPATDFFSWCDSTNNVFSFKANNSATVSNTVVPATAAANQFANAIGVNGVITFAQPLLSGLGSATAAATLANGNNPQTWNCAPTTDAQDCMTFGETSAATNGTLTNALANQAILHVITLSGSTATPAEIEQTSVTGTTGAPLLQLESTWNNASLVGEGILENVTSTASAVGSKLLDLRVANVAQLTADKVGNVVAATSLQTTSAAPGCTVGNAGFWCAAEGTAFTNVASTAGIYPDSTAHEFLAKTNGASGAGFLVRSQPSPVNQTAQTAAIGTSTLCAAAAGACNVAGQYHVSWNFWGSGTACSSVTAGSVTFLLTWTDENAVTHSAVAEQMQVQTGAATTAVQASFPFQTALANESGSGDVTISTNGTVIQYATGYTACTTGTGTYNLRAAVTRLQ